ncbi:hypothetical protein ACRW9N_02465 [Listeria aquatica]|uniref:hypothetical protein n=1 Tax=Listeria aquatica TaxID=1494960 RepID=UPI003EF14866
MANLAKKVDPEQLEIIEIVHPETGYKPNVDLKVINEIMKHAPITNERFSPQEFPEDEYIFDDDGRMTTIVRLPTSKKKAKEKREKHV